MTVEQQIPLAAQSGLHSIRSYDFSYAQRATPALQQHNLSLLAGMHVDGQELVAGWQSQLRLEELEAYHQLGVRLEAICVGNELREGGDEPGKKKFTEHLSHNLANLLKTYRTWLDDYGFSTPLTYAMEGIVFDDTGNFLDCVWPAVEACDFVGVNSYPMNAAGWFTFGAFEESRCFLRDPGIRRARLAEYESRFRLLLEQLKKAGKPLLLTETGFPSAIGYRREGERLIVPESDNALYGEAMQEFMAIIRRLDDEYGHPIRGLYFYEWRDNLNHDKIWNVEGSPIHTAFGLCDRFGIPKFNIKKLFSDIV
jgi:exo-beta-1,3-glucanase (GH17 family)